MEQKTETKVNQEGILRTQTEAEISMEFLEEYRKLVRKYKRDFQQTPPQIIKVEFVEKKDDIQ